LLKFLSSVAQHHDNVFDSTVAQVLDAVPNDVCLAEWKERFKRTHTL
jgi:hypothetical protein